MLSACERPHSPLHYLLISVAVQTVLSSGGCAIITLRGVMQLHIECYPDRSVHVHVHHYNGVGLFITMVAAVGSRRETRFVICLNIPLYHNRNIILRKCGEVFGNARNKLKLHSRRC
jgi:hypothetical protein